MQSENVKQCLNMLHNVEVIEDLDNNQYKCLYVDQQEFIVCLDEDNFALMEALQLCDIYDVDLNYVMAIRDTIKLDIEGEYGLMIDFYRSSQNKSMLDQLYSKSIHLPVS